MLYPTEVYNSSTIPESRKRILHYKTPESVEYLKPAPGMREPMSLVLSGKSISNYSNEKAIDTIFEEKNSSTLSALDRLAEIEAAVDEIQANSVIHQDPFGDRYLN